MKLLEKYHACVDPAEKKQLLEMLQAQGQAPITSPPPRLSKTQHDQWSKLSESKRQWYLEMWNECDRLPQWKNAIWMIGAASQDGYTQVAVNKLPLEDPEPDPDAELDMSLWDLQLGGVNTGEG